MLLLGKAERGKLNCSDYTSKIKCHLTTLSSTLTEKLSSSICTLKSQVLFLLNVFKAFSYCTAQFLPPDTPRVQGNLLHHQILATRKHLLAEVTQENYFASLHAFHTYLSPTYPPKAGAREGQKSEGAHLSS